MNALLHQPARRYHEEPHRTAAQTAGNAGRCREGGRPVAHGGIDDGFAILDMPGGLVEQQRAADALFDDEELEAHWKKRSVVVVELVYLGYFGPGRNINWNWLDNNGLIKNCHPNQRTYTRDEFFKILRMGGVSVEDVVVH